MSDEISVEVVDEAGLLIRTGGGRIPITALERDVFFENFSGSKVLFSFHKNGSVTSLRWFHEGKALDLREVESSQSR